MTDKRPSRGNPTRVASEAKSRADDLTPGEPRRPRLRGRDDGERNAFLAARIMGKRNLRYDEAQDPILRISHDDMLLPNQIKMNPCYVIA